MLQPFTLKPVVLDYQGYIPPVAEQLCAAARKGEDLVPILVATTQAFGFDTFTCGVSMSIRPDEDSLIHVFTTVKKEWLAVYDKNSFIEIDPRVQSLLATGLPMIWDQQSLRGRDIRVDQFLDAALEYGLASGVAVGFVDRRGHPVTVAFNSESRILSEERRAQIAESVGDLLLFAHFFEEMFAATLIEKKTRPACHGAALSARERQCLSLAANGQTSEDISRRLGISGRTVQFHFDSIRSKLGAASRQEAIAKAVQAGIVYANM